MYRAIFKDFYYFNSLRRLLDFGNESNLFLEMNQIFFGVKNKKARIYRLLVKNESNPVGILRLANYKYRIGEV